MCFYRGSGGEGGVYLDLRLLFPGRAVGSARFVQI